MRTVPPWYLAVALVSESSIAAHVSDRISVEALAIQTYNQACLATPISEVGTKQWAASSRAEPADAHEYRALVAGTPREVWRVPHSPAPAFVSLGQQLECAVWLETTSPHTVVQLFASLIESRVAQTPSSVSKTKLFRSGEVVPGMEVQSYVTTFPGERVGVMWTIYVLKAVSPASVRIQAARVKVEA